jgi:hypothetical protein
MSEPTRYPRNETEELARRLTTEIRERDARRAAQELGRSKAKSTRDRASRVGLALGLPVLIALLAMNLTGVSLRTLFESRLPEAVAREEAKRTLDALVMEIEAFRKDYDTLPERLDEIGLPERGTWTYTQTGNGYSIEGVVSDQRVGFNSSTATGRQGNEP